MYYKRIIYLVFFQASGRKSHRMVTIGQQSPGPGLNGCFEMKHAYKAHIFVSNDFFSFFHILQLQAVKSQLLGTHCYSSISPYPDSHFKTKYTQIDQSLLPNIKFSFSTKSMNVIPLKKITIGIHFLIIYYYCIDIFK